MKLASPFILICIFYLGGNISSAQSVYQVRIDLTTVSNDQLAVEVLVPEVSQSSIEFQFPKIVPGTYKVYDFGRFISDFRCFDKAGNELQIDSLTVNRRLIHSAQQLHKISYVVDDTYDTHLKNIIFEPAGTSIEEYAFVMNLFGFVGYLDGMKSIPIQLNIAHEAKMFGTTALNKIIDSDTQDQFVASSYHELVDSPIMYCRPDTTTFHVDNCEVMVSVHSSDNSLSSGYVAELIKPLMNAQKEYLGGKLPVDKYVVLVYLPSSSTLSGGYGALEHSYSSLLVLPQASLFFLGQSIKDITAHEFFHIVTPLNIHSKEIANFDFINPKMSRHLWLYEGMTEYAAQLTQVKYGEMSIDQFLEVINNKIQFSYRYVDSLAFTELSLHCLDRHIGQYNNVYFKGALIGMCLDILLLDLSDGQYGVQQMMNQLSDKYGKNRPFEDGELFDVIGEMTYPEVRDFFKEHVEQANPIPYQRFFRKVGLEYQPGSVIRELSLGHISFGVTEETNLLVINSIDYMNVFGKAMGYQEGDIIYKFDGVKIDIENYEEEFTEFKNKHGVGDKIHAVVFRKNREGKLRKVRLSAKTVDTKVTKSSKLEVWYNSSDRQERLRKYWLNIK